MGKTLVFKQVAVAIAMVAAAGLATASTGYVTHVVRDTATELHVIWDWDFNSATAFSETLTVPDLLFWTVTTSGVFDGRVLQVGTSAQHMVEPHPPVDLAPAPVYFDGLSAVVGGGGSTSGMARHWPGTTFVAPADFIAPHWDHYRFTLSSDANGAQLDLVALHPVPEPATYAMLLGGLALVGAARRRRS